MTIQQLSGRSCYIHVPNDCSIAELEAIVHRNVGLSNQTSIALAFGTTVLKTKNWNGGDTSLKTFNIKNGSVLSMTIVSHICMQWLKKNKFIAGEHVTIADFSAYVEIAQLNKQFTNLFDYSDFKNLSRWLEDMSKLDHHDDVHMVFTKMGDISETAPEMEIIMKANLETFSHLNDIASKLD